MLKNAGAPNANTVHLDTLTLGPKFETHTEESFLSYVNSLKEQKELGKEKSVPRVKKPIVIHDVDSETGRCRGCGKKPRNVAAKCGGAKAEEVPLTVNESEPEAEI